MNDANVPTLAQIWDFLVGLKETTESGFSRLTSQINGLGLQVGSLQSGVGGLGCDLNGLKVDVNSLTSDVRHGFGRIDTRLTRLESFNVDRRFDDHERRITRLEKRVK